MDIYQEDRKILLVGIQISLIVHLILYIVLKLMPDLQPNLLIDKPVQIDIQQIEMKTQPIEKVDISSKKYSVKTSNSDKTSQKKEKVVPTDKATTTIQKEEKSSINIDESNLSMIEKIASAKSIQKHENNNLSTADFIGEPISDIFKNVEGDALSRKVIYRPKQVKLKLEAPWPSIKVKLYIAPSGDVIKVQLLTLTSDTSLNGEIINYLLKWKFNPINDSKVQYAILTLEFSQ